MNTENINQTHEIKQLSEEAELLLIYGYLEGADWRGNSGQLDVIDAEVERRFGIRELNDEEYWCRRDRITGELSEYLNWRINDLTNKNN